MDEKIVELLMNKNELGLSLLKEKYDRLLKFVISNILAGHDSDIEECLNDTYFNLWNGIESYNPKVSSIKNYAVVIARNIAKNRLRTITTRSERMEKFDITDMSENITDTAKNMEEKFILKEDVKKLQDMICNLKEKYRQVLVMKYFYMMDSASIADRFGISVSAVDNRTYKAKKLLKKQYELSNRE